MRCSMARFQGFTSTRSYSLHHVTAFYHTLYSMLWHCSMKTYGMILGSAAINLAFNNRQSYSISILLEMQSSGVQYRPRGFLTVAYLSEKRDDSSSAFTVGPKHPLFS